MAEDKSKGMRFNLENISTFELPEKAPVMKDARFATNCAQCKIEFKKGFLKKKAKKYHCKLCGDVCCESCVSLRVNFPAQFNYTGPQRICEGCLPGLMLWRNRRNTSSVPSLLKRKSMTQLNNQEEESENSHSHSNSDADDEVEEEGDEGIDEEINEEINCFASEGKRKMPMNIKFKDYVGKAVLWYSGAREGSQFDRTTISKLSARKMKKETVHNINEITISVPYRYDLADDLSLEKYDIKDITPFLPLDDHPQNYDLRLRVYHPQEPDPDNLLPVLVWFHGGAFIMGDPTDSVVDRAVRIMCNRTKSVIVSVAYRLAPEFKFPTQPEDCYSALCWVAEHGQAELCVDTTRIAVGGDSAGGNLATVVSLMSKIRRGPSLCHQLLVYPAVQGADLQTESHQAFINGPILTRSLIEWAKDQYITHDQLVFHPYVSPLLANDLSDLPPATIISAYYDPLRDHGEEYAAKLKQHGVISTFTLYKNSAHGFFLSDSQEGKEALAEACATLQFYFELAKL